MVVWTAVNGGPLTTREGMISLEWVFPRFLDLLFSSYHGLFLWSPVLAIGLIGLLRLRGKPGVAPLLAVAFAMQAVINGLVKVWWGGALLRSPAVPQHRPRPRPRDGRRGSELRRADPAGPRRGLGAFPLPRHRPIAGLARSPMTLREMIVRSLRGIAAGVVDPAFWIPSLILPRPEGGLGLPRAAGPRGGRRRHRAGSAYRSLEDSHRRRRRRHALWAFAGVRTARIAPELAGEVAAAAAKEPGVETFIASTSKTYDALFALQTGDLDRAERDLGIALAAWPEDPRPLRLLASLYRKTGREDLATGAERLAARAIR